MLRIVGRLVAFGFALLAGAGLAASLVVHVAALGGVDLLGGDAVRMFALHIGTFVVFVPMFVAAVVEGVATRRRPSLGGRRATLVAGILFAYVAANFLWCMVQFKQREAAARVEATASTQAASVDPLAARAFSGHWLLFYFVPLAYFARRTLGVAP